MSPSEPGRIMVRQLCYATIRWLVGTDSVELREIKWLRAVSTAMVVVTSHQVGSMEAIQQWPMEFLNAEYVSDQVPTAVHI